MMPRSEKYVLIELLCAGFFIPELFFLESCEARSERPQSSYGTKQVYTQRTVPIAVGPGCEVKVGRVSESTRPSRDSHQNSVGEQRD